MVNSPTSDLNASVCGVKKVVLWLLKDTFANTLSCSRLGHVCPHIINNQDQAIDTYIKLGIQTVNTIGIFLCRRDSIVHTLRACLFLPISVRNTELI